MVLSTRLLAFSRGYATTRPGGSRLKPTLSLDQVCSFKPSTSVRYQTSPNRVKSYSLFKEVESWLSTALFCAVRKRLLILQQEPSLEDTPVMNSKGVAM
jgi:hypothetical protein